MKKSIIITFITLYLICNGLLYAQRTPRKYQITKIYPENRKIRIGDSLCGVRDVFSSDEIVHWDTAILDQSFRARCCCNEGSIEMSLWKVRKYCGIEDVSYDGCATKGLNNYYLLWENDTIIIPMLIDTSYVYRISINNSARVEVTNSENSIIIPWSLLNGYLGVLAVSVDRINKKKKYIIEDLGLYYIQYLK